MITKRIIPCFDVRHGRVVKFQSFFANERDAGDPVVLAKRYDEQGADELVMLDISATHEGRRTMLDIVRETAAQVFIPFTVGGGIGSVEEVRDVLRAGADKVSLNSAAVKNPELISESAKRFGSQCVVIAIDAKRRADQSWDVLVSGGRSNTGKDAVAWAREVQERGAGELLVTSFDEDGQRDGYDLALTRAIADAVSIPVIASGGAGRANHFYDVFTEGKADAALAASIFHFSETSIPEVKKHLRERGIAVR
ncbi:imidazole glycerol phosphate synthase subunit HisF [Ferroacidibacillus organovorans]|uniref:Imidazole glycerol phosphate synthase subunit HisF n=1 Tax=Ferroacidibacillus organovorans TaxID=1765683 RepID=A0A117SXH5_9BACL|nr:imidazole glycerol phosphate synthase subunit HisF [Ferroacidibacillus organovorans]KUO95451.1 imidazole glycerol phosphate synthase cyclase subunit [Ferroacidibacillus organovorans]